jgi:hypothetical protein
MARMTAGRGRCRRDLLQSASWLSIGAVAELADGLAWAETIRMECPFNACPLVGKRIPLPCRDWLELGNTSNAGNRLLFSHHCVKWTVIASFLR